MPYETPPNLPKTALITGAGRRIGRAMALSLADQGWTIAVHYRQSAAPATELAARIVAGGGKACTLQADLSQADEAGALMDRAQDALGPIGLLVNNAAHFQRDSVATANRETWQAHMETNLHAPFLLMQSFAKNREDKPGLIVNLLDQWVWNPPAEFVTYTLSKVGLWGLTQTMAMALAPNIRVNAIGPGPTLRSARQSQAHFDAMISRAPLGRATTTHDICQALHYIIAATTVTGQMIALDGGQHLA
ncbi:MAG: SDR family oxidoreductase [Alphaproteobacteria bacterium]